MLLDRATATAVSTLLSEIANGPAADAAYVLNPGDEGLLRSLDKLSASEASAAVGGASSIAAHVDHLRYGLELMNRWSAGENPFADANYSASWRRGTVTDAEWSERRAQLRTQLDAWQRAIEQRREVSEVELTGIISSVVHLAYHLGAMRQINRALRGPTARD